MPTTPATLETFTTTPPPSRSSASRAARTHWNGPFRLTEKIFSQSASVTFSRSPCGMKLVVPALFTSTSSRPNSSTARFTIARHAASSATSARTAMPLTPHPLTSRAVCSASRGGVVDEHAAAALGERERRRAPDARAAACHDRRLALHLHVLPTGLARRSAQRALAQRAHEQGPARQAAEGGGAGARARRRSGSPLWRSSFQSA